MNCSVSLAILRQQRDNLERVRMALEMLLRALERWNCQIDARAWYAVDSSLAYTACLTVALRLLFLREANRRGLLAGFSLSDDFKKLLGDRPLSQKATLSDSAEGKVAAASRAVPLWEILLAGFRAVHGDYDNHGQEGDSPSALGGLLFDPRLYPFLEGRFVTAEELGKEGSFGHTVCVPPNAVADPLVRNLVEALRTFASDAEADRDADRTEPPDFPHLGRLYEGMLAFTATRASETRVQLRAAKGLLVEVPLAELEQHWPITTAADRPTGANRPPAALLEYLARMTNRQPGGLLRDWQAWQARDRARSTTEPTPTRADVSTTWHRTQRFLAWVQEDLLGQPVVIDAGELHLISGNDRQRLGAHYTPRAWTQRIVRHTLEPLVYEGPQEDWPRKRWRGRSTQLILGLRVCDLTCGAGAFLVEVCRFLADQLAEAERENNEATEGRGEPNDGQAADVAVMAVSPEPPCRPRTKVERLLLVSRQCIYGVDKSRLACELTKASLWLLTATADRQPPLTTWENAIRPGDALVGKPFAAEDTVNDMTPNGGCFDWSTAFAHVWWEKGGFDAFVGNPPFLGGRRIRRALGGAYLNWLTRNACPGASGNADLSAFFLHRAAQLLVPGGCLGFITTNTIGQGDTRQTILDPLLRGTMTLYRVEYDLHWPGTATVVTSHLWLRKHNSPAEIPVVEAVRKPSKKQGRKKKTALRETHGPQRLAANANVVFQGSIVLGKGFVLSPAWAKRLIEKEPRHNQVVWPYLTGQHVNAQPRPLPQRYVLNFFDWPLDRSDPRDANAPQVAADFPACLEIVRQYVMPERQRRDAAGNFVLRRPLPQRWWHYADKRPALYAAIAGQTQVLVKTRHSPNCAFTFAGTHAVFQESLSVFATACFGLFAVLSSTLHENWARVFGSTLGKGLRYSPTDCFENFPLPENCHRLRGIGEQYFIYRQQLLDQSGHGLTKAYNRFHRAIERNAEVEVWRELHRQLDQAVLQAYGWNDFALSHDFRETRQGMVFTWSQEQADELHRRLLVLNGERAAAEERQGLVITKGRRRRENNTC